MNPLDFESLEADAYLAMSPGAAFLLLAGHTGGFWSVSSGCIRRAV